MRISVVAPSCPLDEAVVPIVEERAAAAGVRLDIDPQCFARDGHFAGSDAMRLEAVRRALADPEVDAIWCARGGYGSNRIAQALAKDLPEGARDTLVMGYSDAGFLLSALHGQGVPVAHGPMVQDGLREGGAAALDRALSWMTKRADEALEPGLASDRPSVAFNLEVLVGMLGTAIAPRLEGTELLIEEVSEHLYAIDRAMFVLTGQRERPRSLRLGRVSEVPENDPPFGLQAHEIAQEWCARAGIDYRGRAEIGHDVMNRVVPFAAP